MESQQLLSTVEVARALRVHRSTITEWVRKGELTPAVVVPGYRGDFLFEPASVEALREGKAA
jgi:excisionase family DNA binding protein